MTDPSAELSRRLVLVSGSASVVAEWAQKTLTEAPADAVLWIGDRAPSPLSAVPSHKVTQYLGSECRLLVFNAFDGFDPDAFAAAAGTLRGGGDCVVLAPPLAAWSGFPDPYRARIATYPLRPEQLSSGFLERLIRIWCVEGPWACHAPPLVPAVRLAPPAPSTPIRLTTAQEALVTQVVRVAHGHARRPLLLSADRGRGKSTVLGFAAARLLCEGVTRITVIAPHRQAVETLFAHARRQGGLAPGPVADVKLGQGELCFRLPKEGLTVRGDLGMLLVDEAAALPVHVLQQLLQRSNRLVFATTEQGYEGSGRGFRLRFEAVLREQMPRFRRARLKDPIRWAPLDPLEQSINDGLLLNCEPPVPAHGKIRIVRLAIAALTNDDDLLRAVFGLLATAHYQTKPADLRRLLDDPGTMLWIAFDGDLPCGVLLGVVEGGFDAEIRPAILAGTRRPRGHLLPQSLAVHAGIDDILIQRTLRVMRIAVHTAAQRRGTGRRLVNAALAWAGEKQIDALGCAYGVEAGLLAFWMSNGLQPVRLGLRIDPASAAHSVMMLRGLSEDGRRLQAAAVARFRRDLPWSLARAFRELPPESAIALLRDRDCSDIPLDRLDQECLSRIASGARDPATAAPVVWRWLVTTASRGGGRLAPLIAYYLQQWPVARVASAFGLGGAAGLEQSLRERLAETLNAPSQSG